MFGNIAWSEILIIAGIALVVIGPKELPAFLRVAGRYFGKIKGVADDFKAQIDDVVRETQVNDIKDNILKEVEDVKAALPSEKDIGLDFSELDGLDNKEKKDDKFDDEDENLDWDEPDEVIETSADGEVTHHSKKEPEREEGAKVEAVSDEANAGSTKIDSDAETTLKKTKEESASASTKAVQDDDDDYDFDEDDGALLDEEENGNNNRTSMDVLAEGREKFKESLEAELKDKEALKQSLETDSNEPKATKSAKHEVESSAANG